MTKSGPRWEWTTKATVALALYQRMNGSLDGKVVSAQEPERWVSVRLLDCIPMFAQLTLETISLATFLCELWPSTGLWASAAALDALYDIVVYVSFCMHDSKESVDSHYVSLTIWFYTAAVLASG